MDDWEVSGPEEGDVVDQRVFVCNANPDGPYEVIEICTGTLAQKKGAGGMIAILLNKYGGKLLVGDVHGT